MASTTRLLIGLLWQMVEARFRFLHRVLGWIAVLIVIYILWTVWTWIAWA
jgi:hypothetical protein